MNHTVRAALTAAAVTALLTATAGVAAAASPIPGSFRYTPSTLRDAPSIVHGHEIARPPEGTPATIYCQTEDRDVPGYRWSEVSGPAGSGWSADVAPDDRNQTVPGCGGDARA